MNHKIRAKPDCYGWDAFFYFTLIKVKCQSLALRISTFFIIIDTMKPDKMVIGHGSIDQHDYVYHYQHDRDTSQLSKIQKVLNVYTYIDIFMYIII